MTFNPLLLAYALPLLAVWIYWVTRDRRISARSLAVLEEARSAGLGEPASLHPVIDPALCLGCGACVQACPEKSILGIVDGKAKLIEPSHCVGHGACATSCPTAAITLVFGSELRGVDIPLVSPKFETSVPGIYIAGELGGMGLIRNAIEQGRQAIGFIAARAKAMSGDDDRLDVLIVGAGPAGIAASLGGMAAKLRFRTIEQYSLGGTVAHFPRGKVVMTAPAELPLVGKVKFGEVSKETLLAFWHKVVDDTGLQINAEERVLAVTREAEGFAVETTKDHYRTKLILLAIGRRGSPRQLGVEGEDLDKVVYRLIDAEQYRGRHVLIVGGGDSALEAAGSIAEVEGTTVTLSYRGDAFGRARPKNRERVRCRRRIRADRAVSWFPGLAHRSRNRRAHHDRWTVRVRNDDVIICAGGVLPTQFLKDIGIHIETKFGTA